MILHISLILYFMLYVGCYDPHDYDFYNDIDTTFEPVKLWKNATVTIRFPQVIVGNLILVNIPKDDWKKQYQRKLYEVTDPTKCHHENGNCVFGCRIAIRNDWLGDKIVSTYSMKQCNACPNGLYLDGKNGKCTSCLNGKKLANLYCLLSEHLTLIIDDDKYLTKCENGYTLDKNLTKCIKCPIDLTLSGKLITSSLKPCRSGTNEIAYT
uniref:Tyrosine-protein kinase ephrin type A/B receptor-like domain-containing protein n=1 Tax=Panagrolaimus sp. JU765 TaxID=591449 RepID=A0AC34RFC0_9BILA